MIIDILVRSSAMLTAAGAVDAMLRRSGSAAARHLVWSIAVAGALALPIASSALPRWQVNIPVARPEPPAAIAAPIDAAPPSDVIAAEASAADATAPSRFDILSIFYLLYAAGVLVLLARLVHEPFAIRRLTRASQPVIDSEWRRLLADAARQSRVRRSVRLLQGAGDAMPMTFGTFRPAILIPASAGDWTHGRRRTVLLHELAHVARHDCLMQRVTALACALYWPHPGIWWAARRLRVERELACDDRVLAAGEGAWDYAGHLLDLARAFGRAPAPAAAIAMARARHLEHRLVALLDAARNRAVLRGCTLAIAIALSIAVVVPMVVVRAAIVPANRETTSSPGSASGPAAARSSLFSLVGEDIVGAWEVRLSRDGASVQLTLRTLHGSHGRTVPLASLDGVTVSQIAGGGAVRFVSRRDAGTFTFDGLCRSGLCAGTYAFEPDASFAAALAARGAGTPTPQEQFSLAMANFGLAFLGELAADGYRKPDVHELVRAAEHGVDADYVRAMAGLGYRVGTIDALVVLRDHGIDPEYVRGMAASGFARLSTDDLVRARDHGIDPSYIKGMRDHGYAMTELPRVIAARDHGVDPAFASGLAALGFTGLSLDALTQLRDHGVDPEYVRGLTALGYSGLPIEGLLRARDHGVDPQYVRELAALGYRALPLDALIRMRDHGVDPEFVRRMQRGGVRPTVDQLIERRDRGDGDPNATARAAAAWFQSYWKTHAARIAAWLRQ